MIPNVLSTINNEEININILTESSDAYFSFELLKQGDFENPATVKLSKSELIEDIGILNENGHNEPFLSISFPFNGTGYVGRFGIILKESGEFILSTYREQPVEFYFSDENYEDDVFHNIVVKSSFKNSDVSEKYRFNVN